MGLQEGKLIVFSAPSGSGKTTLVRHLLGEKELNLDFSISVTSRDKRGNEIDGRDYHFISLKEFKEHIKRGNFVEWEEVYKDNFYGTLRSEIERIWSNNKHVIFDVDVVGGLNVKEQFPNETLAVFVQPPSIEIMESRLRNRGTDSEEKILERVEKAKRELEFSKEFDVVLVNDDLEDAKNKAYKLVKNFILNKSDRI